MAVKHWLLAGGASFFAHGALFAGLGMAMAPKPIEQQPVPKSELTVTSYQVDQSDAAAKAPEGETARERAPDAPKMGEGVIARSNAKAARIDATQLGAASTQGKTLDSLRAPTPTTSATVPKSQTISTSPARLSTVAPSSLPQTVANTTQTDGTKLGSIVVQAPTTFAVVANPERLSSALPSAEIPSKVNPESQSIQSSAPSSVKLTSVAAATQTVENASAPQGEQIASLGAPPAARALQENLPVIASDTVQPQMSRVNSTIPNSSRPAEPELPSLNATQTLTPSSPAPAQDLPSEFATAALAWSGADETVTDPVSLAAIQAFMQPSDLTTAGTKSEVRDGIESVLASVPCARLQTEFDPTSGSLLLRGHIPENGLRGPVLDALKAQVGTSIPIQDTLLVLPRPQCGALSGIAEVGLPQSTDQVTNPRVVGPQGFARNYSYSNGQRLVLELGAPDYPSVVYVDYFSADGMVLHLQPNTIVPLEAYAPKSSFTVGKERNDGPSVNLTISPPFGQEIAVAFAASTPIYDGLRPVSEPAEPYLRFLRSQIANARARDPDFKGEWVYFFISTTAE